MEEDVKEGASDKYSLRGRVFSRLREDILNGKYEEGVELREIAIGEELGVSRTPVREAFRQLELEGLIRIIPNKDVIIYHNNRNKESICKYNKYSLKKQLLF